MFKRSTIFCVTFITSLLLPNLAIAKEADLMRSPNWGNFSQSCSNITFSNKTSFLKADCLPSAFTVIPLNKYIGNDNGTLIWATNGNFTQTCKLCHVRNHLGVVWLRCTCLSGEKEVKAQINLDERLTNANGALRLIPEMPQRMQQPQLPGSKKEGF